MTDIIDKSKEILSTLFSSVSSMSEVPAAESLPSHALLNGDIPESEIDPDNLPVTIEAAHYAIKLQKQAIADLSATVEKMRAEFRRIHPNADI